MSSSALAPPRSAPGSGPCAADLANIVEEWAASHAEGTACVIRSLTPELAKGLEFDLVGLVRPAGLGGGVEGAVDTYVAMTCATQQLVVLT